MTHLDLSVSLLTFLGLFLGVWGIYWTKDDAKKVRVQWGRWLFVLAMAVLGGTAFVAAWGHALSLAPTGLVSVFLVVAMLWETPAARVEA